MVNRSQLTFQTFPDPAFGACSCAMDLGAMVKRIKATENLDTQSGFFSDASSSIHIYSKTLFDPILLVD